MPLRNFRLRSNQPSKAVPFKADLTAGRELSNPDAFFPYAPYISATGVHVCLLVFTAFYLPRTTLSFLTALNPFQAHTLAEDGVALDALSLLTSNPLRTVMLMCGGALLLQAWWASWLKTWSLEMRARSAGETNTSEASEQKLQRGAADSRRIQVRSSELNLNLRDLQRHCWVTGAQGCCSHHGSGVGRFPRYDLALRCTNYKVRAPTTAQGHVLQLYAPAILSKPTPSRSWSPFSPSGHQPSCSVRPHSDLAQKPW